MIGQAEVQKKGVSQVESQALMNHSIFMTLSQIEEICNYLSGDRKSKEQKKFGYYDPCDYRGRNFDTLKDQLVLSVFTVEQHHKLFRKRHPGKQIELPGNFNVGQVVEQADKYLDQIRPHPEIEEIIFHFKEILSGLQTQFNYEDYFSPEQKEQMKVNGKVTQNVYLAQNITESISEQVKINKINTPSKLKAKILQDPQRQTELHLRIINPYRFEENTNKRNNQFQTSQVKFRCGNNIQSFENNLRRQLSLNFPRHRKVKFIYWRLKNSHYWQKSNGQFITNELKRDIQGNKLEFMEIRLGSG